MESEKCAIKVHLYDKSEYVLFEKQKVGDWAYFLRTCEYEIFIMKT